MKLTHKKINLPKLVQQSIVAAFILTSYFAVSTSSYAAQEDAYVGGSVGENADYYAMQTKGKDFPAELVKKYGDIGYKKSGSDGLYYPILRGSFKKTRRDVFTIEKLVDDKNIELIANSKQEAKEVCADLLKYLPDQPSKYSSLFARYASGNYAIEVPYWIAYNPGSHEPEYEGTKALKHVICPNYNHWELDQFVADEDDTTGIESSNVVLDENGRPNTYKLTCVNLEKGSSVFKYTVKHDGPMPPVYYMINEHGVTYDISYYLGHDYINFFNKFIGADYCEVT